MVLSPPPVRPRPRLLPAAAAESGVSRTARGDAGARWLRRGGLALLAAAPLTVFALFFFYPVGTMLGRGLLGVDPSTGMTAGLQILAKPRVQRVLLFTVSQAALSAALCLILGLPCAFLLYRRRFRGRATVRALVTAPFVLPTVVVALAFRTLFAPGGPLGAWGWDGSVAAILAAHVCLNCAVVIRMVGVAWSRLDTRPAEAARTLGAGPLRVFGTITLPALGPAVASAFAIVFLFCATSFGIVLIMGGGRFGTIETEIYRQTMDLLDLPAAAVLSLVQLLLVAMTLAVASALRRRTERSLTAAPARATGFRPRDWPLLAAVAIAVLVTVGPLAVLAIRSLRSSAGWTLANYRSLTTLGAHNISLVPATQALANSLRAAAVATVCALLLGLSLTIVLSRRSPRTWARRLIGGIDALVMLPLGVSAVTVGFGFLIALDRPPLDLRGSAVLVPLAQALVATPLVVRMLLPVARALDDRLRQAAGLLGAGPVRVWRDVDLPLLARPLAGAAAFAFAVCLGEFGATSFVATPQAVTLPVLIARLISRPGPENTGTALAAATLLAVLCVLVVAVVDGVVDARAAVRPGGIGAF